MKYNPEYHHRRSIRLKGYDYSSAGAYFVTICLHEKACLFGEVNNAAMILSPIGKIVQDYWLEIPQHFENVELGAFIVMPNHLHGILNILDVGVQYIEPLQSIEPLPRHIEPQQRIESQPSQKHEYQKIIPKSIGSIVRSFKAAVTRWCNDNGNKHFKWQRNFHERVIRNEKELIRISEYVLNNPAKWEEDKENPKNWRDNP